MMPKEAFEKELVKLVAVNPDRLRGKSPEDLRAEVEARVDRLLDSYPEEAAVYAGFRTDNREALRKMFIEEFIEGLSSSAFSLEERSRVQKEKYIREVAAIPELKERYFPGEQVILFRPTLGLSLENSYILFDGDERREVYGVDLVEQQTARPVYGVFRVVRVLAGEGLDPADDKSSQSAEYVESEIRRRQLKSIDKFVFAYRTDFILQQDLESLEEGVKKPRNKSIKNLGMLLYHTSSKEFHRLPEPRLGGADKVDWLRISGVFGLPIANWPTYLSLDEGISLSHYVQQGIRGSQVYEVVVNPDDLVERRNLFIDPEVMPLEIGFNYIVGGGIPRSSIREVRELERTNLLVVGSY